MYSATENRFYELLCRKLTGEADIAELKELEQILHAHPEFGFLYDQVLKPEPAFPVTEIEAAYMAHYVKMLQAKAVAKPSATGTSAPVKKKNVQTFYYRAVAALLILCAGMVFLIYTRKSNSLPAVKTIAATEHGSKSKLVLPDGTIVHLNTNSNLSYNEGFGHRTREVHLTGEAFFEVAHNADVPFIVHTAEADIKVLGTVFNVRDYADEKKMEASLLKGSIELALRGNKNRKFRLAPSDKVVIDKYPDTKIKSAAVPGVYLTTINMADSVVVETSWLDNKLAFTDKPFSEIALDLKHQFGVTVIFQNPVAENYRYTGVFDDTNADDILKILQMIKPFQYRIESKEIIIF